MVVARISGVAKGTWAFIATPPTATTSDCASEPPPTVRPNFQSCTGTSKPTSPTWAVIARASGAGGKIPVFVLIKRSGEVLVILSRRCDGEQLNGVVLSNVKLDSIVYTDSYKAYNQLSLNGLYF